jgi:thiol-disulfide isomerase/thioredoxin
LERLAEQNKSIEQAAKLSEAERQLSGILYLENDKIEELPNVTLFNFLSDKYKGKVLYIDVWATWCGPCMEEFKSTPNLHNHFKDRDVVFVNLCLSSNIDSWKPTILRNNVGGENYFLDEKASQLFMGDNNLGGFPSYLIIDKNGEIHYSAPRPSDLESAIKKIESCLQ